MMMLNKRLVKMLTKKQIDAIIKITLIISLALISVLAYWVSDGKIGQGWAFIAFMLIFFWD